MSLVRSSRAALLAWGAAVLLPGAACAAGYPVQVTAHGAACDGRQDDSDAVVNAIKAAGPGGTVQFPSGICVISGARPSIALNNVALLGAQVPHFSDAASANPFEAGSVLSIGTADAAPGANVPFRLGHSVTIRGMNFVYPFQIAQGLPSGSPVPAPPLFSDVGGYEPTENVLFEDVHVVAAYEFWSQSTGSPKTPTYGNIRFSNTDIYAIARVFDWANVKETVTFNNVISNSSLCHGGDQGCSPALKNWTADNGVWLRVKGGLDTVGKPVSVGGILASNLTVAGYKTGILVEDNGHLDESTFGPTTVFDGVPFVLYVNRNGSVTHSAFSGRVEFGGRSRSGKAYTNAAFTLNNPQRPLPDNPVQDQNTLSLNGLMAEGIPGPLLHAEVLPGTEGSIGSITMTGMTIRHYCNGGAATNAVDISTPMNATQATAVIITGSQITTNRQGCGGLNVNTGGAPFINANNLVGVFPLH